MTNINNASDTERLPMKQPTMRIKIMRGIVAPFFAVLAVLSFVFGIVNATLWKPNEVVIAHARVDGTRYIVTDPGVLDLVDSKVRISVAALRTRKPICVAVGLVKDVRGWVAGSPVKRITGLLDWERLDVSETSGKNSLQSDSSVDTGDPDVPFKQSNLWSNVTCQLGLAKFAINTNDFVQTTGSASYDRAVESGSITQTNTRSNNNSSHRDSHLPSVRSQAASRVLLIDLGSNAPSAMVELRWRRHHVPDFATPLYFVGILFAALAVLAATIFAMAPHRRRNRQLVASRSGVLTVKPARSEEVGFVEALMGTLKLLAYKRHHKRAVAGHGRHGCHARRRGALRAVGGSAEGLQPTARIAVASSAKDSADSLAETTVISKDELLAFAARFAQQHDSDSSDGLGSCEASADYTTDGYAQEESAGAQAAQVEVSHDNRRDTAESHGESAANSRVANADGESDEDLSKAAAKASDKATHRHNTARTAGDVGSSGNPSNSGNSSKRGNSGNSGNSGERNNSNAKRTRRQKSDAKNCRNRDLRNNKAKSAGAGTKPAGASNSSNSSNSSGTKSGGVKSENTKSENTKSESAKSENTKPYRANRRGYRSDRNDARYRKGGKNWRGNSSSNGRNAERGSEK